MRGPLRKQSQNEISHEYLEACTVGLAARSKLDSFRYQKTEGFAFR
jgi:hypothetical protein